MVNSPCDLWEGNTVTRGYGVVHIATVAGKRLDIRAHRLVWLQEHGYTDLSILHSCDNPPCVNLDHLRAGTQTDNMQDMAAKGRWGNQTRATG